MKSMKVKHIDHIGINVNDLPAAKAFFMELGFALVGEAQTKGEFLDSVIGLKGAETDFVMLEAPGGQLRLEVIKYLKPDDPERDRVPDANNLGLGHIAFEVDNLEEIVARIKEKGYKLIGEIRTYQDSWKLCYVRGPGNIIVELAERH